VVIAAVARVEITTHSQRTVSGGSLGPTSNSSSAPAKSVAPVTTQPTLSQSLVGNVNPVFPAWPSGQLAVVAQAGLPTAAIAVGGGSTSTTAGGGHSGGGY
jgi:hypothetical protein